MTAAQPDRKDMAEFFRLALRLGICDVPTVVRWADSIVEMEPSPHVAFIELCISGSQSSAQVLTLLHDVPGRAKLELPVHMLLGHASRVVKSQSFLAEELLIRLYHLSTHSFPRSIYYRLATLEDEYALAKDGVYGVVAEVIQEFSAFLADYEAYAPDVSGGRDTH
jgi:hypothetical protein